MSSQQNWPPAPPGGEGSAQVQSDATPGPSRNAVFQALADRRRRRILDVLLRRPDPISEHALATELATMAASAEETVDGEEVASVRQTLRHLHLPALEAVPLVHWDREDETVRATDHPAMRDETIRSLVAGDVPADDVMDALANERRRIVLAVLHTYGGPVEPTTVAEKVRDLERDGAASADENSARDVGIALQHVHLPKLDEAGLVRRDEDAGTVSYVGHPDVDESWFTF